MTHTAPLHSNQMPIHTLPLHGQQQSSSAFSFSTFSLSQVLLSGQIYRTPWENARSNRFNTSPLGFLAWFNSCFTCFPSSKLFSIFNQRYSSNIYPALVKIYIVLLSRVVPHLAVFCDLELPCGLQLARIYKWFRPDCVLAITSIFHAEQHNELHSSQLVNLRVPKPHHFAFWIVYSVSS